MYKIGDKIFYDRYDVVREGKILGIKVESTFFRKEIKYIIEYMGEAWSKTTNYSIDKNGNYHYCYKSMKGIPVKHLVEEKRLTLRN